MSQGNLPGQHKIVIRHLRFLIDGPGLRPAIHSRPTLLDVERIHSILSFPSTLRVCSPEDVFGGGQLILLHDSTVDISERLRGPRTPYVP